MGEPAPLRNTHASSAPRSGEIGVLPVTELLPQHEPVELRIAVECPDCSSYARIEGVGTHFSQITKLIDPIFECSACEWRPTDEHDSPQRWTVFYRGRIEGTLLWAVNEIHLRTLREYFETNPKRRGGVEFDWEYARLMQRLPEQLESGRRRHDVVNLIKRLQTTKPRHLEGF